MKNQFGSKFTDLAMTFIVIPAGIVWAVGSWVIPDAFLIRLAGPVLLWMIGAMILYEIIDRWRGESRQELDVD